MTATHCLRGHDIAAVGRSPSRMCRECLRAWDRARNQRRRSDPAYAMAESYRALHLASQRRMVRKTGELTALVHYARSIGFPEPLLQRIFPDGVPA